MCKSLSFIKKDFPQLPEIQIHLHKAIPIGAGLGGGSADATFTLLLLNKKYNLGLSQTQLHDYCLELGSDCAFFLYNKPCFATGRGDLLQPIELSLKGYKIGLAYPGIHISTADAFSNIQFQKNEKSILEIIQQPISTWKKELKNDFENTIFPRHPSLQEIKTKMYDLGALYASMTGSGSSIYGIFEANFVVNELENEQLFQRWVTLN